MLQETNLSESSSSRKSRTTKLLLTTIGFLTLAGGAGGWFYYSWKLKDVAAFSPSKHQKPPIVAMFRAAPPATAPSAPKEAAKQPPSEPGRPHFQPSTDPIREIQEN